MTWAVLVQDVAAIERLRMEKETLRYKAADQQQQIAAQAQKLEAQEQRLREQGEAVKGQEQQVVNLEQQVDGLLSKLKDEQKGKEAAVTVSSRHGSHHPLFQELYFLPAVMPSNDHRLCHWLYHACIIFVILLTKLLH